MICIYHSKDLDGWMSGAIVKLLYPDVESIGWDYGQSLPEIDTEDQVIMVDVSFPKDVMVEISQVNGLIWIDHHISAINDIGNVRNLWGGIQSINQSACELTWKYFFPNVKIPEIVRLLGRYDCFGHKGTEEELKVLEFQYGARQLIGNISEAFHYLVLAKGQGEWDFDTSLCEEIHFKGQAIYAYLCSEARHSYIRKFLVKLDGYKFACINQERFNPINFGIDYHLDGYDGFACFWYDGGQYHYSLYNDNGLVDCSVIAKKRGGGGHKGASGFISKEII
jgi:uncharacterized protein